jgi:heme a synthase
MTILTNSSARPSSFETILVTGVATSVAVWTTWFLTHLPWLGLQEQVALPIVLAAWIGATAAAFALWVKQRSGTALRFGAWSGVAGAAIGLLLLGSKVAKPVTMPDGTVSSQVHVPSAVMIAGGFLVLGAIIGVIGAGIGSAIAQRATGHEAGAFEHDGQRWLGRLAVVTCVAVAPMLFIGGLVTSTNSGMAVPDWPRTYGANMFLYPLGARVAASMGKSYDAVFFEHAHRLFGTLIGLATLALLVLTLRVETRRWVRRLAIACFVLVVIQGVLGGIRVLAGDVDPSKDARGYAIAHGVLAQLCFGLLVGLAVAVSSTFRSFVAPGGAARMLAGAEPRAVRRLKTFSTAALHTLILQLLLGAVYRHTRHDHVLYTHAAFAMIVMGAAILAAMTASGVFDKNPGSESGPDAGRSLGRTLRVLGGWTLAVVVVQFVIGWIAFFVGGKGLEAQGVLQALVRTIHQANGALLLALVAAMYVWALAIKRSRASNPLVERPSNGSGVQMAR